MGNGVGEERFTTYEYGDCMVVCGTVGGLVE